MVYLKGLFFPLLHLILHLQEIKKAGDEKQYHRRGKSTCSEKIVGGSVCLSYRRENTQQKNSGHFQVSFR